MRVKKGATRVVLIGKARAYKLPRLFSWRCFLNGLLANMTEAEFGTMQHPMLAPVLFSIRGGFLVVMPTCDVSEDIGESLARRDEWFKLAELETDLSLSTLVEHKGDSIGMYNGRLVAIDYG